MEQFPNGDAIGHQKMRLGVFADLSDLYAFETLSDGSSVSWDCRSRKFPQAKLTSTQSFTIDMTNVIDGAIGTLKLITDTASAITITLDTDFTNKTQGVLGEEAITTIVMPASTGKEYILQFIVDDTTIHWFIETEVPQWTDYSSTITGFASTPPINCRYLFDAARKLLHFKLMMTPTTSNATTFTFTIPYNAKTEDTFVAQIVNNGTAAAAVVRTRVSSNIVDVYSTIAFAAFTASGNKNVRCAFSVETE